MNDTITQGKTFTDTGGRQGVAQFNPNTGGPLSAGQSVPVIPVSQTQDATAINNQLSGNTQGLTLPAASNLQSTVDTHAGLNASVPAPGAVPSDTAAQVQQNSLLQQKAQAIGGQKSLATNQIEQENQAGLPGMASTIKSLTNQLQGITDQGTLLANAAASGGSIQNQEQQNAQGRGITNAGLAPQTAGDLRKNQIQQSALAAQSIQIKSQLLAAQGQYSDALAAADKAAQVIFDSQTQQINAYQAQLDALAPQLKKDEQAQLDAQTAANDAKKLKLQYQREDYLAAQGLINAASANNPGNPQVQMAISKANQLDPNDPNYLQKVSALVNQFQKDPNAVALQIAQIEHERALTKQINDANSPAGTQKQQDALEQQYRQVLLKEMSNRSGGLGLQDAKVNQAIHLKALFDQFKQPDGTFNIPAVQYTEIAMGLANLVAPTGQVSDSAREAILQKTAAGDFKGAITYLTGTPQTGNTQAVFKNLYDSIDRQGKVSEDLRDQDIKFLHGLAPTGLTQDRIDSLEKNTLASYRNPPGSSSTTVKGSDGKDYTVGKVYTDKTGNWTIDANGKWTKQQ